VLAHYAGSPQITADWGDLTVVNLPAFAGGVSNAVVSLNRETSPGHMAHVTVTDGTATGTTLDLTVTAPAWQQMDTSAVFLPSNTAWDQNISNPTWIRWNGEHHLYYYGTSSVSTNPKGIGYAHSPDGNTWTRYGTAPVMPVSTSGWDMNYPPLAFYVQIDGAGLAAGYPANAGVSWGFARSTDGATWTKDANGLNVASTPGCSTFNEPLSIFVDGNTFWAFFQAGHNPCYVTSTDHGHTFGTLTATSGFSVVLPNAMPAVTQVLREGSVLKMWYQPNGSTVGGQYATSTDGQSWIVSPSGVVATHPQCVLWNEAASRYEGLIYVGNGFGRMIRP
jgi:hypothetical protein